MATKPQNRRKAGTVGEDVAAAYLERNGYTILERNYYFEHAEIDLIAKEGADLVFVEVKARRSNTFGEPEDAITPHKEELIRRAADGYLYERNIEDQPCRFDVVAISFKNGKADIRLIRDAF